MFEFKIKSAKKEDRDKHHWLLHKYGLKKKNCLLKKYIKEITFYPKLSSDSSTHFLLLRPIKKQI